jgi:hypothetical protein
MNTFHIFKEIEDPLIARTTVNGKRSIKPRTHYYGLLLTDDIKIYTADTAPTIYSSDLKTLGQLAHHRADSAHTSISIKPPDKWDFYGLYSDLCPIAYIANQLANTIGTTTLEPLNTKEIKKAGIEKLVAS